jgi:hypothetical protein
LSQLAKLKKSTSLASLQLEVKEVAKIERDLLCFLLVASYSESDSMLFPTFAAIAAKVKKLISDRSEISRAKNDIDLEIRTEVLVEALYRTGIPLYLCKRNAKVFMVLRPDFDLNAPKYRRIKSLLDFHADEFVNAYLSIGEQNGRHVADQWLKYIRDNDIIFARICALPDDMPTKYLFGGL